MADAAQQHVLGGRYRLGGRLGAGPGGNAWRAHDEWLRVDVAVKRVLPPPAQDGGTADAAELRARAARRAGAAARLRGHPHVAALLDVVVDGGGTAWTVTHLVEGRSLADHLDAYGPLSASRATDVARALLAALDAAYAADLVHLDVKASNVLLAADGGIWLTDVCASGRAPDPELARLGIVDGTPGHVAPERVTVAGGDGEGAADSPAADLFALGVTLYQAVEGRLPFDPADPWATVSGELPAPVRAGRLAPLLTALLARDPARRPSAREASALVSAPAPYDAPPPAPVPAAVPGRAPGPGSAVWLGATATPRLPGPFALESASEIHDLAFSPDGTVLATVGDEKPVRMWDLTSPHGIAAELDGHGNWGQAVAFSPDGTLIATGGYDRTVRLWDTATGRNTATLDGHTDWVRSIAFSPDGRTLASAGDDKKVRLWDPVSGGPTATLPGHPGWIHSIAFGPDGRTLAAGGGKEVRIWDLASAAQAGAPLRPGGKVRAVAFSPDGTLLAVGGRKFGLRVLDAVTHAPLPAWPGAGGRSGVLAFSPDGTLVASCGPSRTITLRDARTAKAVTSWTGEPMSPVRAMAFSPDGTVLAVASGRRVRLWRVPPAQYTDAAPA
ncbi:protein kinase family protein [Streptomyces sp. NRRL F-5123]|uniref:protein kinase family protein n=1 Tax=Streptomyces sp. NRRL F-5123 TaxID=1463856 RepID=UPI000693E2B0|nr:WD40 repeat domain-containing serine/threonine-protein kinase [Streptomyces sp. NRRL F-5123]